MNFFERVGLDRMLRIIKGGPDREFMLGAIDQAKNKLRPNFLQKLGCIAIPLTVSGAILTNIMTGGFENILPNCTAGLIAFGLLFLPRLKQKNR